MTTQYRINKIQEYANTLGVALALPKKFGTGTTGFNDCTAESQARQLDIAANYLLETV